jgi:tRNA pseudouridine38-40 synthase
VSIALRIAYDGTAFHGFVRQAGVRTVQAELAQALSRIYKQVVEVRGASRTDAGVHARGQLVAFDPPLEIPTEGLLHALRGELPEDLGASAAWEESGPDGGPLNPRFGNDGKHYAYRIRIAPDRNPLTDRYEWHTRQALDLDAVREAAAHLVGEHDFSSFRAADCQSKTTVRVMTGIRAGEAEPRDQAPTEAGRLVGQCRVVVIDVEGQAFLKNMVRVMVGTLVEVGLGKRSASTIPGLIAAADRTKAGDTAPARGLTLVEVKWPRRSG